MNKYKVIRLNIDLLNKLQVNEWIKYYLTKTNEFNKNDLILNMNKYVNLKKKEKNTDLKQTRNKILVIRGWYTHWQSVLWNIRRWI